MTQSILDFFPKDKVPRPQQVELLLALESAWDSNDIFILNAPVSVGKSAVAVTISKWVTNKRLTSSILTKDKMLVNQYATDYPGLPLLRAGIDYRCAIYQSAFRAKLKTKKEWKSHRECDNCVGCESLYQDTKRAKALTKTPGPFLSNMHIHLAHRLYKKVLVIDEAHNLVPFLQELHTKFKWRFDLPVPANCWSRKDFKKWIDAGNGGIFPALDEELDREVPRHSILRTLAPFRGRTEEKIELVPFDIRGEAPLMWPGKGTKLVFLSATINSKDLERMGLEDRRWIHIEVDSAIKKERRPIYMDNVKKMSYLEQARNLPEMVSYVSYIWSHYKKTRGLVHIPYGLAAKFKELGIGEGLPLFFHTQKNKQSQFQNWLRSKSGILVASGMSEGLDLVGDKARWQVVGKVPWPSLADPVIKDWSNRDPVGYLWETLKQLIQMSGRVCRSPEDFGATHIFDSDFDRLLKMCEDAGIVPAWWKAALVGGDVEWTRLEDV